MAVMARDTWSDQRLDDLNARVESIDRRMEARFKEVREEFRAVRGEIKAEGQAIRAELAVGLAAVRAEMAAQTAALNQTIYRLFGGMLIAWVVGVIAIIARA